VSYYDKWSIPNPTYKIKIFHNILSPFSEKDIRTPDPRIPVTWMRGSASA
jgi:hypothetical protein